MIRIAVCDNDRAELDKLNRAVSAFFEAEGEEFEISLFKDADELSDVMKSDAFDVMILDVATRGISGIELAEELRENGNSCEIIFTAQTQEHAYEAYSVNAVQYILKPYHTQRLNFALARAMAQIKNTSPGYTVLRTSDGIRRVGWNEIVNSSTMGHYQIITLTDGTELKFRSTSDELYSMLEESGYFMRVGSPYIVNVKRVREIASRELVLDNGAKIPLPKNSYKLISNTFIEMEERLRK